MENSQKSPSDKSEEIVNRLPEVGSDPRLPVNSVADPSSTPSNTVNPGQPPIVTAEPDSSSASSNSLREPGDGQERAEEVAAAAAASGLGVAQRKSRPPKQRRWTPNPDLLEQIVNLGFPPILAEKALFYTNNSSADQAVGWILDNPEAAQDNRPLESEGFSSGESDDSDLVDPQELLEAEEMLAAGNAYKMVFVVNTSLKMGLGKVAAQVAHGTLGLYRKVLDSGEAGQNALAAWDTLGETKVVLKGENDVQLMQLEKSADEAALSTYMVVDAGRTQIAPGSTTVLAIFGPISRIDAVTGQLKLI